MDLTSLRTIKALLRKHNIQLSKSLGQNFLINKQVLKKILESAQLQPMDIILEIGPGLGILTKELAERVWRVIVVEKDRELFKILQENFKDFNNIKFIQGDITENIDLGLMLFNYKIVSNLPYSIAGPVLKKFLESKTRPNEMVIMVQKEVAQRICSKPPDMNLLAVFCQFYGSVKITAYVPKDSFWPQPDVDGAILKISEINSEFYQKRRNEVDSELYLKIARASFSPQPRKQLLNNLREGLQITQANIKNWLLKNGIQPTQRAETLTIEDWLRLTKSFEPED